MRRDLESNTNMGALAVEQLLSAAEAPVGTSSNAAPGAAPTPSSAAAAPVLDMTLTEDEAALSRMQQLNQQFRASSEAQLRKTGVVKAVRRGTKGRLFDARYPS